MPILRPDRELVTAQNSWGRSYTVQVPHAVGAEIRAAVAAGATIRINKNRKFTGTRAFGRTELLYHHVPETNRDSPFLVYACFDPRPAPAVLPATRARVASYAVDYLYLPPEIALALLAYYRIAPPRPGESVTLPTGATLDCTGTPGQAYAWSLRGRVAALNTTFAIAHVAKPAPAPGPGLYRYAAVFAAPDPTTGRHEMRPTNDREYAARLVRYWESLGASAVVLEGVFRRGQHQLTDRDWLTLIGPGRNSGATTETTKAS